MLSPRSRGKGSRRIPIPISRGKQKPAAWRKQAVHAIDEFPKNGGEVTELTYHGPFGHSASESIYLFDQRVAPTGIRYQAEWRGSRLWPLFVIRVPTSAAAKVSAIIARITKR